METPPASIYMSKPFLFVVEDHVYYLHDELVAQATPVLDRLMHSDMKEKAQVYAVLQGVDKETFGRFAQFVYTGRYDVPLPELQMGQCTSRAEATSNGEKPTGETSRMKNGLRALALSPGPAPKSVSGLCAPNPCKIQKASKGPKPVVTGKTRSALLLRQRFKSQASRLLKATDALSPSTTKGDSNAERSAILLAHAKLYVFSDEKDAQALRLLALRGIYAELSGLILIEERVGDVIKLIDYVYDNTHFDGDDLRGMVIEYMVMEAETLSKSLAFKELIVDVGGPLLEDFLNAVSKRMEATS